MDLVYIWYDYSYRSNNLFNNTLSHAYDLKVKVTVLELLWKKFRVKVSNSSYFRGHTTDLVYILYIRYRSKALFSNTAICAHGQG